MSVPTYYVLIISSNVIHLNPPFTFLVDNQSGGTWMPGARSDRTGSSGRSQTGGPPGSFGASDTEIVSISDP